MSFEDRANSGYWTKKSSFPELYKAENGSHMGHAPVCEWDGVDPRTGKTWQDMPGNSSEDKKLNWALFRRGLYSPEEKKRFGGIASLDRKPRPKAGTRYSCAVCGGEGHNRATCPEWTGKGRKLKPARRRKAA